MMPVLVVGIGNADRGDDGVGSLVARLVRQRRLADSELVREPLDVVDLLAGRDRALIVDACQCEVSPGALLEFDLDALRRSWNAASQRRPHGFEVIDALRLADAFGVLPARTKVLLVAGCRFGIGQRMSKAVRQGALDAVEWIADYVRGEDAQRSVVAA